MENKNNEPKSFCVCSHCRATKYCPTCNVGYKGEENFCGLCSSQLTSMEVFENEDCPICSKIMGLTSSKTIQRTMPMNYEPEPPDIISGKNELKMAVFCNCGNYTPRGDGSSRCICGGEANVIYH